MAGEQDLYKVLGVARDASQADIRKAYHRLALQLHPDKAKDDEEATQKFQSLKQIYAVLGDPDKRKRYDQTGSLEDAEELGGQSFDELYRFYRDMYKQVSPQDIDAFSATYRGSADESRDLVELYHRFKGAMPQVFQWQMCSDAALDSHRFCALLRQHCQEAGAKEYPAFAKWAKAVDKRPAPKDPLKPRSSNTDVCNSEQALVAALQARAQERGSASLAALEAKYCSKPSPGKRKRGSKARAEPAEDDEGAEEPAEAEPAEAPPAQASSKPGRRGRSKGKATAG